VIHLASSVTAQPSETALSASLTFRSCLTVNATLNVLTLLLTTCLKQSFGKVNLEVLHIAFLSALLAITLIVSPRSASLAT
jgi:hypothetical protein